MNALPSRTHACLTSLSRFAPALIVAMLVGACGGETDPEKNPPDKELDLDRTELAALMDNQTVLFSGQSNAVADVFTKDGPARAATYNEAGFRTWTGSWEQGDAAVGGDEAPGVGLLLGGFAWLLETEFDISIDMIGEPWDGAHIDKLNPSSDNYNDLKERVTASGAMPQVFLWHQGESDGVQMTTQAEYRSALEALIAAWRSDYPTLKYIVVFETQQDACGADQTEVRAAQEAIAADDAGVLLVNTDSLNKTEGHVDDCHFDWQGYEQHAVGALKALSLTGK